MSDRSDREPWRSEEARLFFRAIERAGEFESSDVVRILADWLEERGDGARAEFLRLEMECERTPDWEPVKAGLRRRARELEWAHPTWLAAALPPVLQTAFELKKAQGMFQGLELVGQLGGWENPAEWDLLECGLETLSERMPIRTLALGAVIGQVDLDRLLSWSGWSGLVELEVVGISPRTWIRLAERLRRGLPRLTRLHLGRLNRIGPAGVHELLREAPPQARGGPPQPSLLSRLRVLNLFGNRLGGAGLTAITHPKGASATVQAESLETLDLGFNNLKPADLRSLWSWEAAPRLRRLSLAQNPLQAEGGSGLLDAVWLEGLVELDLGGTRLPPKTLADLVASPRLKRLECLRLSNLQLDAAVIEQVLAGMGDDPPPRLDLSSNYLDDDGLERLARWSGLARVVELNLSHNEFSPSGLKALADSPHTERLKVLRIADNRRLVTPRGLQGLVDSPLADRLTRLDVAAAPGMEEELKALLTRATLALRTSSRKDARLDLGTWSDHAGFWEDVDWFAEPAAEEEVDY